MKAKELFEKLGYERITKNNGYHRVTRGNQFTVEYLKIKPINYLDSCETFMDIYYIGFKINELDNDVELTLHREYGNNLSLSYFSIDQELLNAINTQIKEIRENNYLNTKNPWDNPDYYSICVEPEDVSSMNYCDCLGRNNISKFKELKWEEFTNELDVHEYVVTHRIPKDRIRYIKKIRGKWTLFYTNDVYE